MNYIGKEIDRTYQFLEEIDDFELYYKNGLYYLAKDKLIKSKSDSEADIRLDAIMFS